MSIEQFQIQIEAEALDDLMYRLKHVRWPERLGSFPWERGTDLDYLKSIVSYWIDHYDWRVHEAELNRHSQFRCNVDGFDVHFVHERGKGPNPMPIILTHGWPDSFVRYQKVIPLLTDPARYGGSPEDSFDVIVPSLPGFGFSGNSGLNGINNYSVSGLWAKLMTEELGYPKFAAGGGDIGSGVTRYLALTNPELLIGIHLTDVGIIRPLLMSSDPAGLSEEEQQYRKKAQQWISQEGAYMSLQSTKPQTLAYGLSDSPLGLASWIIEKFRAWSDCKSEPQPRLNEDELLTNIMVYWVTNTIGSSANMYYENMHSLPPMGHIEVPTGVALFPADILLPPKEWAQRNLNISHWRLMPSGGHFTAMEEPDLFAEDVRTFFRGFRS
jgi:pimeloyl-ACP methyl ester carboxylesterase